MTTWPSDWHLSVCAGAGGQPCRTESLLRGILCYLQVDIVSIELNGRTLSSCPSLSCVKPPPMVSEVKGQWSQGESKETQEEWVLPLQHETALTRPVLPTKMSFLSGSTQCLQKSHHFSFTAYWKIICVLRTWATVSLRILV